MNGFSSNILTAIILVSLVFGLFVFSASARIRNSWQTLRRDNVTKQQRLVSQLDLVLSGIFLAASITFYSIFWLNVGR